MVCVTVTVSAKRDRVPRASRACPRGRRRPSPCRGPGESAWNAPQANATQQQERARPARGGVAEHVGEAVIAVAGRARPLPARRLHGPVAGPHHEARRCARRTGSRAGPPGRCAGRSVGSSAGDARAHRGALAGLDHDRLPADAAREGPVAQLDPPRAVHARDQRQLDARGPQPALALRVRDRPGARRPQRDAAAVDGQRQPPLDLGLLARAAARRRPRTRCWNVGISASSRR